MTENLESHVPLKHQGRRISFIGGFVLAALTLVAGISVYAVMQRRAELILSKSLQASLQGHIQLTASQIDRALNNAQTVASRIYPVRNLQLLESEPGNATATAELQRAADSFLKTGFTGLSFLDVRGREVAHAGKFSDKYILRVQLKTGENVFLLWEDQFILHTSAGMFDPQGHRIGTVLVEENLPQLTRALDSVVSIGKSGEFVLCSPTEDGTNEMYCFPSRISGTEFSRLPRIIDGKALPMNNALNGETGIIFTNDYRREQVVATYAPVGTYGLGAVLKIDQKELYGPVTERLKFIVPMLIVLILVGMLLLNILVAPLVRKLIKSEQATRKANSLLSDSEARTRAILDSVDEGIFTVNINGFIESFNPAAEGIFGYRADEIIGQHVRLLTPGAQAERHEDSLQTFMEAGGKVAPGALVSVTGRRKNGDSFPMEVSTSEVQVQRRRLFIASARDITARKQTEQRLLRLASHDALTGLPNRNLLQDRIRQALIQAHRSGEQGAVLFIDLDQFKAINDSMGHDVGDLLLKQVAQRLTASLRGEDTVARQGGDEFIVLLPTVADAQDAGSAAERLLTDLLAPYQIESKELHISASIGISVFPDDGVDADTLLKHSDTAMYHAKETGRNNFQFFAPAMNKVAAEKHALISFLRHALERDEFLLYYQPVIDMLSGELAGLEALLRWKHPMHGLVSPLNFISLAEETGLIVAIGEWVLKAACMQLKMWRSQNFEVPRMAINLSAKQFHQKNLLKVIERILHETGIDAHSIELEITESILMDHSDEMINTLRELSDMGLNISIDDFGIGYSSLGYLRRFPIDTLKIDRSFVEDIVTSPDDALIVAGIIGLAHSLRMTVIAEGVETDAQRKILALQGCDKYQGFYFSNPLPAAEIASRLRPR